MEQGKQLVFRPEAEKEVEQWQGKEPFILDIRLAVKFHEFIINERNVCRINCAKYPEKLALSHCVSALNLLY